MSAKLFTPGDNPAQHNEGDLMVWYIPQVPGEAFERFIPHHPGDDQKELSFALILQDVMLGLSAFEFEHRIKPDYSDAAGIARWETDGETGYAWYEVDESELTPILEGDPA